MTAPRKSQQQLAAERRARRLLKERDSLGLIRFEALQLKRQAARIERCRARTRAAVAARRDGRPVADDHLDVLPFEESA